MLHEIEVILMSTHEAVAREWAGTLVRRELHRSGMTKAHAADTVARRVGMTGPGLYNIITGRTKRLTASMAAAIRNALIRDLESEVQRLPHELDLLRAGGADPRSLAVGEIESLLAQARSLIEEGAR